MDQGDIVRLSGVVSARLVFPAAAAAADVTGFIHLLAAQCEVRPYDGTLDDGADFILEESSTCAHSGFPRNFCENILSKAIGKDCRCVYERYGMIGSHIIRL